MTTTDIYLRFPSFDVARAVAGALLVAASPPLPEGWQEGDPYPQDYYPPGYITEDLQPDGVYGANRYDIIKVGTLWEPTGEVDGEGNPVMAEVPGYHVLGRFRGPDPMPEALAQFEVPPWNQVLG